MNIFVLSEDPIEAAQMQCDKHVVKMVLESAQMMSTISDGLGGDAPYRPTHRNHPCTVWASETRDNWRWLVRHAMALASEYNFRYGRIHKSAQVIHDLARGVGPAPGVMTPFRQCMPDAYKTDDPVLSYRMYYAFEKRSFARWNRGRDVPDWWDYYIERIEE